MRAYEEECNAIVRDTYDKFIDLGQDDGPHSIPGDHDNQEKFRQMFGTINFKFEGTHLQMPKGDPSNEELLEQVDGEAKNEYEQMGNDLNQIFDILYSKNKMMLMEEADIIALNFD